MAMAMITLTTMMITTIRSKQRDPNPKDNSFTRKETSTRKGFLSTVAAWLSYEGVFVRVRVSLFATPTMVICPRSLLILSLLRLIDLIILGNLLQA